MNEWSHNQNRMLSTIETRNNPKITYYICGCFPKRKYKNSSFNTETTLTDDLLYVIENPLKKSTDSYGTTTPGSTSPSSSKSETDSCDDNLPNERNILSQVAIITSKIKGNVRFSE